MALFCLCYCSRELTRIDLHSVVYTVRLKNCVFNNSTNVNPTGFLLTSKTLGVTLARFLDFSVECHGQSGPRDSMRPYYLHRTLHCSITFITCVSSVFGESFWLLSNDSNVPARHYLVDVPSSNRVNYPKATFPKPHLASFLCWSSTTANCFLCDFNGEYWTWSLKFILVALYCFPRWWPSPGSPDSRVC